MRRELAVAADAGREPELRQGEARVSLQVGRAAPADRPARLRAGCVE
jgi:hypothetical protein